MLHIHAYSCFSGVGILHHLFLIKNTWSKVSIKQKKQTTWHNVNASRGPRMTLKYSPSQSLSLIRKAKVVKWISCKGWLFIQMRRFCVHKFPHQRLEIFNIFVTSTWACKKISFHDFMDYLMMKLTIRPYGIISLLFWGGIVMNIRRLPNRLGISPNALS